MRISRLAWVVKHARTREEQELALGALRAKCDILWAMLDALYFAYVLPGWPPPGAFQPDRNAAMKPEMSSRPQLAPGCRLNEKDKPPRMLLMPERALRLNGPSLEIVERCDGCAYRSANYFGIAAIVFEGRARKSGAGHSGVSGPAEHAARAGLRVKPRYELQAMTCLFK